MRKYILITTDNSRGDEQIADWEGQEIRATQTTGDEDKRSFVRQDTEPKPIDTKRDATVLSEA